MKRTENVESVLEGWIDPYLGKSLTALKAVRSIEVDDQSVHLTLALPYPAQSQWPQWSQALQQVIVDKLGVAEVHIQWQTEVVAHTVQGGVPLLAGVKNIIAVASGKGGVGKSTTAVNLALALSAEGAKVGILDADIHGPSVPLMLGLSDQKPVSPDGEHLTPLEAYGIQAISIGFLVDQDQPIIWRGPMVVQALNQLLRDTQWDNLDYLVIDLPPGTGDIQLSLSQKVPVTGAVIVTTPQDLALLDARKGLGMFNKVNIPVLGIIENMSLHQCSACGQVEPIFGQGGGEKMAADFGVTLLGQLPLSLPIREAIDQGCPTVVAHPDSEAADRYRAIARQTAAKIASKTKDLSSKFPKIVVKNV